MDEKRGGQMFVSETGAVIGEPLSHAAGVTAPLGKGSQGCARAMLAPTVLLRGGSQRETSVPVNAKPGHEGPVLFALCSFDQSFFRVKATPTTLGTALAATAAPIWYMLSAS